MILRLKLSTTTTRALLRHLRRLVLKPDRCYKKCAVAAGAPAGF